MGAHACSSLLGDEPQASKAMLQIENRAAKEQEIVQSDTQGSCKINELKLFSKRQGCTTNCRHDAWHDVQAHGRIGASKLKLNGDLNQEVRGEYIYLAYKCCPTHKYSRCDQITDLRLTKTKKCPSGYRLVE